FASLEIGLVRLGKYTSNISLRAPGSPTGVETNPRSVFRRLFGDTRGDAERRSLLDLVQDDARLLRSKLGRRDQEKVDEYLESVRSIEKRIEAVGRYRQKREAPAFSLPEVLPLDPPER